MPQIAAGGHSLEYQWIEGPASAPALVFLHEGLGSIAQWRGFPALVAKAAGCRALVYDRYGYGNSDVFEEARAGVQFMHDGALKELPDLLRNLGIENPVLVGHSDGASIALIHAGNGHPVRGIAAMAPHVFVEEHGLKSIRSARNEFETTYLPERLERYHRDARRSFHLWNDVWLDPAFGAWNIEECLPRIRCPLLAIQGEGDEYGSMAQLDAIARQAGGPCELLKLPECGHAPYKDQPEKVLQAVAGFVKGLF
jgi:pimeloyl-ACP methyl ester carboxylesterase